MEYESSKEPLPTNHTKPNAGTNINQEIVKRVEECLKQGMSADATANETGICKNSVLGIRSRMERDGKFEFGTWKKNTARIMQDIVSRGSERLLDEIENIPASSLPLAIAIMTDKAMALQDAPSVVVEHRLKVSHHDINALIKGETIDVTPVDSPVDNSNTQV